LEKITSKMVIITLFVFLMILSSVAEIFRVYLGIPEVDLLAGWMNTLVMLVISVKFGGIFIAFLVQQYERN
jgi:hypothetical protein